MAEPKTAVLLSVPKSAAIEQKTSRSLRFELALQETTKESYSEFSYLGLVSKEKEKHVRLKAKANGSHPAEDSFEDSDDNIKEIARRFEEKYGTSDGMQRKKHRDISELGQGYDENDPFIDNSDVHDEDLPSNKRTGCGGFYINKGTLHLELIEGAEPDRPPPARRKRVRRLSSDADDDVTTGEEQEPGGKRPRKRLGRPPKKDPSLLQKKKRRAIDGLLKRKPALTVKEMLEQKKVQSRLQRASPEAQRPVSPPIEVAEENSNSPAQTNGRDSHDSMDETIATVVAAARQASSPLPSPSAPPPPPPPADRKASSSSNTNGSSSGGGGDSSSSDSSSGDDSSSSSDEAEPEAEPERTRRPSEDDLPRLTPELSELVTAIKAAAELANRTGEGKQKFFTAEVNKMLLNIELRCQQELLRNDRQAVYLHLAAHLPCGAQTLTKRAKQLMLDEEKTIIRRPLHRLKEAITAAMPALKERHAEECRKVMEAKELPMPDSKKTDQSNSNEGKKPTLPRKRFRWNEAARERLHRVIEVRAHSFKMLKKRQGSAEEFLKPFLESEVLPLWEKGWMTSGELMKRCLPVFQEEIKKKTRPPLKQTGTPPKKAPRLAGGDTTGAAGRVGRTASPRPRPPSPAASPRPRPASPAAKGAHTASPRPRPASPAAKGAHTASPRPRPASPAAKGAHTASPRPRPASPAAKGAHTASPRRLPTSPDRPPLAAVLPAAADSAADGRAANGESTAASAGTKVTKASDAPLALDQLWKVFTPNMSVEAMTLLLQEQMRDMRKHLEKKLLETGGQSSPEIVRYTEELRRLQTAFEDASKLRLKAEKKKRVPKPSPAAVKPSDCSAPGRRPSEKRHKVSASGAESLRSDGPTASSARSGSPQEPAVNGVSPQPVTAAAAAAREERPAAERTRAEPVYTASRGAAGTVTREPAAPKTVSPVVASVVTPAVVPAVSPSVTSAFQLELEKLRQGMNSSAQRCHEQRQQEAASANRSSPPPPPAPPRRGSLGGTGGPQLPSPEQLRTAEPRAPPAPPGADRHHSPKKIHLYGRSQSQPAAAAGSEATEAEAAVIAADESEKKKSFREINEAEVNDAVASIIGASDAADFSLCVSPEPVVSRRRSGSESRTPAAAADMSLRRPSVDSLSERLPATDGLSTGRQSAGDTVSSPREASLDRAPGGINNGPIGQASGADGSGGSGVGDDTVTGASSVGGATSPAAESTFGGRQIGVDSMSNFSPTSDGRRQSGDGWSELRRSTADSPRGCADVRPLAGADGAAAAGARAPYPPPEAPSEPPLALSQPEDPPDQGLDLSAGGGGTGGKRTSRSEDDTGRLGGAPDQLGEELDWVMKELMIFNNQRKEPEPASPPARSSILQMTARQADIFSPDAATPSASVSSPFSASRSPFSPDAQPSPPARSAANLQSAFTPSRSAVLAAFEGGAGPRSQPQSLQPSARTAFSPDSLPAGSQAGSSMSSMAARPEQQPRRQVRQEAMPAHAEGLMAHFTARSELQKSPLNQPTSPASPHTRLPRFGQSTGAASAGFRQDSHFSHAGPRADSHLIHPSSRQEPRFDHPSSRQEPQFGHPISRQEPQLSHPSPRQESQLNHHSPRQEPQLSHPNPRQESQLNHPSPRQEPQFGHSISRQESQLSHPSPRQESQQNHPSPRQEPQFGHPISRQESQLNHPSPRQESQLNHPNPRQESQLNHPSPRQEPHFNHPSPQDSHLSHHSSRQPSQVIHSSPRQEAHLAHSSLRQEAHLAHSSPRQEAHLAHSSPRQEAHLTHSSPRQEAHFTHSSPRQELHAAHSNPRQDPHLSHPNVRLDPYLVQPTSRSDSGLTQSGSRQEAMLSHAVSRAHLSHGSSRTEPHLASSSSRRESQPPHSMSPYSTQLGAGAGQPLFSAAATGRRQSPGPQRPPAARQDSLPMAPPASQAPLYLGGESPRDVLSAALSSIGGPAELTSRPPPSQPSRRQAAGAAAADRGVAAQQRVSSYYTSDAVPPHRPPVPESADRQSTVPSAAAAQAAALASQLSRDSAGLLTPFLQSTAHTQQFRPPAPLLEMASCQTRQPASLYEQQFVDPLADYGSSSHISQDQARRRQKLQLEQQRRQQQQHQQRHHYPY